MIALALKALLTGLCQLVISWIPVVLASFVMDAIDEAMETLLEKEERKAAVTPDKADDRRLALYRKYWESFMAYSNRKANEAPSVSEGVQK